MSVTVNPEMETKVLKQVEFYFSDSNYPRDKFLRAQAALDEEGYVPLDKILLFERMKQFGITDLAVLASILRKSEKIQVKEDGTMIKRKDPLPGEDTSTPRTIYTKGWGQEITLDEIEAAVTPFAAVKCIRIRKNAEKKPKGSAFVEVESEEKAKAIVEKGSFKWKDQDITVQTKDSYFKQKKEKRKLAKLAAKQDQKGKDGKEEAEDGAERPAKRVKREDKTEEHPVGAVVKFKGVGAEVTREFLKDAFSKYGKAVYVDFSKGDAEGLMRMENAEAAQLAVKKIAEDKVDFMGSVPECMVIEGEEEEAYWKKVAKLQKQRMFKKSSSNRGKKKRF